MLARRDEPLTFAQLDLEAQRSIRGDVHQGCDRLESRANRITFGGRFRFSLSESKPRVCVPDGSTPGFTA